MTRPKVGPIIVPKWLPWVREITWLNEIVRVFEIIMFCETDPGYQYAYVKPNIVTLTIPGGGGVGL